MKEMFRTYLELSKINIALLTTLSAATGYILATGQLSPQIFVPVIGVLCLACSSGTLNQYQERKIDAQMQRTKNRPLPSGRVRPSSALSFVFILMITGASVLYWGSNLVALGLGACAIIWYNGVYTYLKKWTALAVIPGSLIGAVPPLIGWSAAGRSIWEPSILSVAIFFFIWQIPHFWLLLLRFGKDYEQAGLPSLTQIYSQAQLAHYTFSWIVATSATCVFMLPFLRLDSVITNFLVCALSVWLVWTSVGLLQANENPITFRTAFRDINLYALFVIILLSVGKLVHFGRVTQVSLG